MNQTEDNAADTKQTQQQQLQTKPQGENISNNEQSNRQDVNQNKNQETSNHQPPRQQEQPKEPKVENNQQQTRAEHPPTSNSNSHTATLIKHRLGQVNTLRTLIKTLQEELKGNQFHLHVLQKEKTQWQDQVNGLDSRLKGILREKEVLFARLMTAQRDVERLQGL